ncbi:hypothetical protein NECID01_1394 [Nematocida sp. AWRm77]|nr:hypothetical protein NECID01_1394 [Nematocida sp. AWRm77]
MIKHSEPSSEESSSEYSGSEEEYFSSTDEECSSDAPLVELFDIVAGECPGTCERIELLINQLKMVDVSCVTEAQREKIFSSVAVRAEVESLEEEAWVTSVFSLVPYGEIAPCMFSQVQREMGKLSEEERGRISVFLSPRYRNIPDETIGEMYAVFGESAKLPKDARVLFVSAEYPITSSDEAEIKKAFSSFKLKPLRGKFPVHPEEIFLSINGLSPLFVQNREQSTLTGWLLDKKQLDQYITSVVKFHQEK